MSRILAQGLLRVLVVAAVAAVAAAPAATAADHEAAQGPALVPVAFHPYPDESDILGFPAPPRGDMDHYMQAYRAYDLDKDGFDFPHVVVDGVTPIEGIPDGTQPFASTKAAYAEAITQRSTASPPVSLRVESTPGPMTSITVTIIPRQTLPGEDLHLRIVLVEDHVFFQAPAGLNNGITDHRFTARSIQSVPVDLSAGDDQTVTRTFDVDPDWQPDQLYGAVWLQQGPERGGRFDPLEVAQAALHRVGGAATLQEEKAVLLETYTASWCDACVYGDLAIEELAQEHGAGTPAPARAAATYWEPAIRPWLIVGIALLLGGAVVFMPGRQP